jgi:hypothetical protein
VKEYLSFPQAKMVSGCTMTTHVKVDGCGRRFLVSPLRTVTVVALLGSMLFPATLAWAGAPNVLCPSGFEEMPNSGLSFDDVGCSLCSPEAGCVSQCLTVPVTLCPPGPSAENTSCCTANPCNGNCPEPKPLLCSFQNCQCEPEGCCFVVCPSAARAPAVSSYGLIAIGLALAGLGILYARRSAAR